jgi:RNA polymerase sigma-70 factor, ECF subfamily
MSFRMPFVTKQRPTSMTDADLPSILPAMLPKIWVFALRLCGDQHDAEDLVQKVCVRALERAHQLHPGTKPLSWVFSIVHSIWMNELRARQVRSRSSIEWDDDFLDMVADRNAVTPEEHVMHGQIIAAVERLSEPQRLVMLLIVVEGLSYSEAAKTLGVPVGTVMSRFSRARQAIGSLLGVREDQKTKHTKNTKESCP